MSSKRKVVVSRDIGKKAFSLLSELDPNEWEIILWKDDNPAPRSWLEHNVENADGLLVQLTDKVRFAMLD
jgi:sulfur carrier protein ThiS